MRIIELPEGKGYANILVDDRYIGRVWIDERAELSMGKTSWMLQIGIGDVFIHADAIRRKE